MRKYTKEELRAAFPTIYPPKLTAVTISFRNKKHQGFYLLEQSEDGKTILPSIILDKILSDLDVPMGSTFTIG